MTQPCPQYSNPGGIFKIDEPHWYEQEATIARELDGYPIAYGGRRCSYCGSIHPDDFMRLAAVEGREIIPTDKNYKAYIILPNPFAGQEVKYGSSWRDGESVDMRHAAGPTTQEKFYFYHLSESQMREFVDLYNAGNLKIGNPGHFYRLPYFMRAGE